MSEGFRKACDLFGEDMTPQIAKLRAIDDLIDDDMEISGNALSGVAVIAREVADAIEEYGARIHEMQEEDREQAQAERTTDESEPNSERWLNEQIGKFYSDRSREVQRETLAYAMKLREEAEGSETPEGDGGGDHD